VVAVVIDAAIQATPATCGRALVTIMLGNPVTDSARFQLDPLLLARSEIPGKMLFWKSDAARWFPIGFYSML